MGTFSVTDAGLVEESKKYRWLGHTNALSEARAQAEPCTSRWPVPGDHVRNHNGEVTKVADWELPAGAIGIVTQVDRDGDFKLLNPKGEESDFQYRSVFVYVQVNQVRDDDINEDPLTQEDTVTGTDKEVTRCSSGSSHACRHSII